MVTAVEPGLKHRASSPPRAGRHTCCAPRPLPHCHASSYLKLLREGSGSGAELQPLLPWQRALCSDIRGCVQLNCLTPLALGSSQLPSHRHSLFQKCPQMPLRPPSDKGIRQVPFLLGTPSFLSFPRLLTSPVTGMHLLGFPDIPGSTRQKGSGPCAHAASNKPTAAPDTAGTSFISHGGLKFRIPRDTEKRGKWLVGPGRAEIAQGVWSRACGLYIYISK